MLGLFYFVLNSSPLIRDVTCSVTLLGGKYYEEAMSDKHPQKTNIGNRNSGQFEKV